MTILTSSARLTTTGLAAVALMIGGCANMSDAQRSSAIGAGAGALAGVAIGDSTKSTAIGAGLGALGGYIWSNQMAICGRFWISSHKACPTSPTPRFALLATPTVPVRTPSITRCQSTAQPARVTTWPRAGSIHDAFRLTGVALANRLPTTTPRQVGRKTVVLRSSSPNALQVHVNCGVKVCGSLLWRPAAIGQAANGKGMGLVRWYCALAAA